MAETRLRRNVSRPIPSISLNDRPLFMQNGGRRRFSATGNASDMQEISNFRRALPQFLAVSVKNILLFVYGMTLGFPTIVIPAIQGGEGREPSDIILNKEEISWFSSINLICVPLGCLFSGALTQPIGKRRAMQFVNLPILASWLLFHFSTRTEHLYGALLLSGLGGGLMEAPVLTYVAEITEPKYRGILSALGSTCVITGVFIQFIMGSLMDWRTVAAVSSAFPVCSIIALCFIPESPTWLIREERFHEAVKALQWLRGWVPEQKIEAEFNRLYNELITQPALEEAQENANNHTRLSKCTRHMRLFRKRSFLVPFLLVTFTFFTGHFSGKTALQTYAVQIFHTLKAPINKYHATILLGVAELVATILCVFLIHFTGKRPLVLISTIGVGVCFFGTAMYAHYLQIVPGFAVNNVVTNASSIVPKESIISQENITKIFETEKQALLESTNTKDINNNETIILDDKLTALLNKSTVDGWTTAHTEFENHTINKREEKSNNNADDKDDVYNRQDEYNINLLDLAELNYTDPTDLVNYTSYLDLLDSQETTDEHEIATTIIPIVTEEKAAQQETIVIEKLPSTKEVVNEILLPVPKQKKNDLVWLPLILLLAGAFFAHFGIRMIPWILIGEVFPAPVRSTASGLVSGLGYIFGFLANKLFLQMITLMTFSGTFWFYSAVALFGAFCLYFTLPETEGRTLAEIEAHFSKKSKTNLLKKSKEEPEKQKITTLQMENVENLHIPIGPQTEAKIIQLKQSDFLPNRNAAGEFNMAFDENNTTKL